jgi:hypothetical protein
MSQITSSIGSLGVSKEKPAMAVGDLKSLIELGCIRDELIIDGKTFKFRTLSSSERVRLVSVLGTETLTQEKLYEFNLNLLAHGLDSVNDKPLETYHPDFGPGKDTHHQKLEILSFMQTPVINKLLEFYNELIARCDSQFSVDTLKK